MIRPEAVSHVETGPELLVSFVVVSVLAAGYERVRATTDRRLTRTMNTDEVTGESNRRHFELMLAREVKRAQRYGRPLSLLLFDVDDFKAVNDTAGHPTGDRVLREIAAIVSQNIRDLDTLARIGGDEFAIIAPETGTESSMTRGGLVLAQRVCRVVDEYDFGLTVPVTITVGTAAYRDGDIPDAIVQRADRALYRAKSAGKNRVMSLLEEA